MLDSTKVGNFINGMAHITGDGIEGNLCRVIPEGLCVSVYLSKMYIMTVLKKISV